MKRDYLKPVVNVTDLKPNVSVMIDASFGDIGDIDDFDEENV